DAAGARHGTIGRFRRLVDPFGYSGTPAKRRHRRLCGTELPPRPHAHARRMGDAPFEALRKSERETRPDRMLAQLGPVIAVPVERLIVQRKQDAADIAVGLTLACLHEGIEGAAEKSALGG